MTIELEKIYIFDLFIKCYNHHYKCYSLIRAGFRYLGARGKCSYVALKICPFNTKDLSVGEK